MIPRTLPHQYVLYNGTVLAGDELEVTANAFVAIDEGRIHSVGPVEGAPDWPRYSVDGMLVMPGMINGHTHIEDAAFLELPFGRPASENLLFEPDGLRHVRMRETSADLLKEAIAAQARVMLRAGIVAFADYKTGGLAGATLLRDALRGIPIECLIFAGHSSFPVQSDAELDENVAELSAAQLADIEAALEVADGFAPVRVNDTTDPALEQIRTVVRDAGKRLSTHAAASPDYREHSLRRTGRSDIARVVETLRPDFVVHMTDATEPEIREIAQADIPMVMCPRTMAALGRPVPPYAAAVRSGAVVGLGTDNAMTTRSDLWSEADFLARIERSQAADPTAVDARALLRSMTIDGAKAIQVDAHLGSITPGKRASMVLLDMHNDALRFSENLLATVVTRASAADIAAVLVDGKPIDLK